MLTKTNSINQNAVLVSGIFSISKSTRPKYSESTVAESYPAIVLHMGGFRDPIVLEYSNTEVRDADYDMLMEGA